MKICGIKASHDAAVAVIENGKLLFSVELEKLEDGKRYTKMHTFNKVYEILHSFGMHASGIDSWVLDGWKQGTVNTPVRLDSAPYHEFDGGNGDILNREEFFHKDFPGKSYSSYRHVAGHIVGAYALSPFSKKPEPCAVITWDGGQNPRLHMVDPAQEKPVRFVDSLFEFYGIIYGIMGYYFGPYKNQAILDGLVKPTESTDDLFGGYDIPGKLMSYIAFGKSNEAMKSFMLDAYISIERDLLLHSNRLGYNQTGLPEHQFCWRVKSQADKVGMSDEDVLLCIHEFLEELLVFRVCASVHKGHNLIFTGGSALNIKWNTALRESGHFASVWVPPVPNDSGSAIGAAACEMAVTTGMWHLNWSVYSGPRIKFNTVGDEWSATMCSVGELASVLANHKDRAVVVLYGHSEIGPRALGHRSIFMSAELASNKDFLNKVKKREDFRPVAPICLESAAPTIFDPGTSDPYMLFDHKVRAGYQLAVPAIVHTDNTARLQTVGIFDDVFVFSLLTEYFRLTGIPLLCNTSANLNGGGFFPDTKSACQWASEVGIDHVYCDGYLLTRNH
jgi:carbamoyltransferase